MRGIWNMPCWNALSEAQQERLLKWGNLPIGYVEQNPLHRGAEVEVTTVFDESPGPRFYCLPCAAEYLRGLTYGDRTDSAVGGDRGAAGDPDRLVSERGAQGSQGLQAQVHAERGQQEADANDVGR